VLLGPRGFHRWRRAIYDENCRKQMAALDACNAQGGPLKMDVARLAPWKAIGEQLPPNDHPRLRAARIAKADLT
jgi:hypothetical protein